MQSDVRARRAIGANPWMMLALVAYACGPATSAPDAGDAGSQPDAATPAIAAPALPSLAPCDPWPEASADGATVCEPAAEATCEPGTVRYAGRSACEPIGSACPSGDFPSDLPAGAIFVRAGASGDGSMGSPFGTIGEALGAASSGGTIAIEPGSYDETIVLPSGVELRGACASMVTITRSDAGEDPVITLNGGSASIRDLSIRSDAHLGILTRGALDLDGVILDAAVAGVAVLGGSIDARELHIPHTRTDSGGRLGRAIDVEVGGRATLTRCVIEDSGDGAIGATGSGSALTIDDVAIRGTRGNGSGQFGSGVGVFEGATATVHRAEIVGTHEAGVIVDVGILDLSDSVVRGARSEQTQGNGYGVFLRNADATIARVWIDDCQRAGLGVFETSTAHATDLVVTSTAANPFEIIGVGVGVSGGSVELTRALVADSREYGVLISAEGAPSENTIDDLTVLRTSEGANLGIGVGAFRGATVRLSRLAVRDALVLGVDVADEGTALTLSDADISGIEGTAMFDFGRAIEVDTGAHATVTRARLRTTRESSAVAYGAGSLLELHDVDVSDIRERACASSTCTGEPGGIGVAAIGGGHVRAERLRVEGAPLCGVQIAVDGEMDLSGGRIAECAIGACVQVEGFDITRLTDAVEYANDGVNVDLSTHQVPVPVGPSPDF